MNMQPLHAAAAAGNADVVRHLLLQDPASVDARDVDGATPLYLAAYHARIAVVDLLISFKADVAALTVEGQTPLSAAARHYQSGIGALLRTVMLLSGGTDIGPASMRGLVDIFARISIKGRMALALTCLEAVCQRYGFHDTKITRLISYDWTFLSIRTNDDWGAWNNNRPYVVDGILARADEQTRTSYAFHGTRNDDAPLVQIMREKSLTPLLAVLLLDEELHDIGGDTSAGAEQATLISVARVVLYMYTLRIPLPDLTPFERLRYKKDDPWGNPVPLSFFRAK